MWLLRCFAILHCLPNFPLVCNWWAEQKWSTVYLSMCTIAFTYTRFIVRRTLHHAAYTHMHSHCTYQNIAFVIEMVLNTESMQDWMQQFSCISHTSHSYVVFCVFYDTNFSIRLQITKNKKRKRNRRKLKTTTNCSISARLFWICVLGGESM